MELAILRTGEPPPPLAERFGHYEDMFARLLGSGLRVTAYDVQGGILPERPEDHAAYLVTGSPAGVYDPLPWIAPLKHFLRAARGKAKLVGVCFGHQVMAEAFGGRVEKSGRGWGVGLQTYEVLEPTAFMAGEAQVSIPVSHQDQVVERPPHARVVAANLFSPFGVLVYDDQPAVSMQFHPEFEPDYAKALIETRRERLPDPDAAIASLDRPNDRERVGAWIRRFLEA